MPRNPRGFKKAFLSGASEAFLRTLGIDKRFIDESDDDDEEGGCSRKQAKEKYPKGKLSEDQKLWVG